METRLIAELNHEIAKMKTLAQYIGPCTKDNQQLREKLAKSRQHCKDLCKHVGDNILPRMQRQNHNSSTGAHNRYMMDKAAQVSILVDTLESLVKEMDRLYGLVSTFPVPSGSVDGVVELTPLDTFICLTSTGCVITPNIALVSAEEIRKNHRQMEANRILCDKREIEEIVCSLRQQVEIFQKSFQDGTSNGEENSWKDKAALRRTASNPTPHYAVRTTPSNSAGLSARRNSIPSCCVLCSCTKSYM